MRVKLPPSKIDYKIDILSARFSLVLRFSDERAYQILDFFLLSRKQNERNTSVTQGKPKKYTSHASYFKTERINRQQIVPTCTVLLGLAASTLCWSTAVDDPLDVTEIVS